jgi:ABC-type transport system substrate-binding protein
MIVFSRTPSVLMARTGAAVLLLSFMAFADWPSLDLHGQAPAQKKPRVEEEEETPKTKPPAQKRRVEEEEDSPKSKTPPGKKKRIEEEEETPKTKAKPKVIRVEEEETPKTKSGSPRSPTSATGTDLNELAEQTKNKAVKKLYRELAVPHDVLVFKRTPGVKTSGEGKQREDNIEPTPYYLGTEPSLRHKRLRFTPLTDDWKRSKKPIEPLLETIQYVRAYEEIARDDVHRFLQAKYDEQDPNSPLYLSRYDMLVAAEQVLTAVLRWHESAKLAGQRNGPEWSPIEAGLRKQLLEEVMLEQMKILAADKDWDRVLELTRRLAHAYTNDAERKNIFRPVADMIRSSLRDPTGNRKNQQEALKRLYELQQEFPNNQAFQPLTDVLMTSARERLREAEKLLSGDADPKKLQEARRLYEQAKETWPLLPELAAFESKLGFEHPVLHVGVRGQLPQYLSPARACTENERRAVDLLFESLVKPIPDEYGGYRYRPGLAQARPRVVTLGRKFELPRNAFWSDGKQLNAADVDFSLTSLQNGRGAGRSRVWGDLLAGTDSKRNPFQVTLLMKQGFLDPLALMSFKILPRDRDVQSEAFAQNPVTSGPYRFDPNRQSDEKNRPCRIFVANPSYSLRPTKRAAPRIQEIRFYTYKEPANPVRELLEGTLDLALDLTAKEAVELQEKQRSARLPLEVPLPSAAVPNRRIYFLAINTRKLPDVRLRRALAFAINREALLDKHFRAPLPTPPHRALYGPFPSASWACNPNVRDRANKNSLDLHNPGKARDLSQGAKVESLTLKYPLGDAALDEAMKDLSAQVKELTGIDLKPTPCTPYQLREDVEQTPSYDVAYCHYDFPDESYWLSPLFSSPPGTEVEKNIFMFNNSLLSSLLAKVGNYRDFAEVRRFQWQIHELLNGEMPLIPLWQLDPLLAYRREIQPVALEPLRVFANVEEWRIGRK